MRVTVIAAGFDAGGPTKREDARALGQVMGGRPNAATQRPPAPAPSYPVATPAPAQPARTPEFADPAPASAPAEQPVSQPPRQVRFEESDDLDVPDFLK